MIAWIMRNFSRLVDNHKECLHPRSKKAGYPAFIWIETPLHENFLEQENEDRNEFNKILNKCADKHENTWSLQLRKIWILKMDHCTLKPRNDSLQKV